MIDALASERHFVDHLAPVWHALPDGLRGRFLVADRALLRHAAARGIDASPATRTAAPLLVASYGDQKRGRRFGATSFAFLEHGAGQSYGGDPRSAQHGSYAGGRDRDDAALFLVPNERAAARWHATYPGAEVHVVGSPKIDELPARAPGPGPVVAISFHWPCAIAPEARTAFPHYRTALPAIARRFRVLGHGHPRFMPRLAPVYRTIGIEPIDDFDEVLRRADMYVADNSSTLFEFAATGRPVVVLNAPWYRRHVDHGLRFWDAATVGSQVDEPWDLVATVERALADPPDQRVERERVVAYVYARPLGGAARAAAEAIAEWLAGAGAPGPGSGAKAAEADACAMVAA
jgi:hypothetical protein